jgi:hypothetical protein
MEDDLVGNLYGYTLFRRVTADRWAVSDCERKPIVFLLLGLARANSTIQGKISSLTNIQKYNITTK